MKNTSLTVTLYIGGKQVDEITSEQREQMAKRLSERMSAFYATHPQDFLKLKGKG